MNWNIKWIIVKTKIIAQPERKYVLRPKKTQAGLWDTDPQNTGRFEKYGMVDNPRPSLSLNLVLYTQQFFV